MDDDHKNDAPNERMYVWKNCYECDALDIARKEILFYKDEYDDIKRRKENGDLKPCYEDMIKKFKEEYKRRKEFYEKFKELIANQCDSEEKTQ